MAALQSAKNCFFSSKYPLNGTQSTRNSEQKTMGTVFTKKIKNGHGVGIPVFCVVSVESTQSNHKEPVQLLSQTKRLEKIQRWLLSLTYWNCKFYQQFPYHIPNVNCPGRDCMIGWKSNKRLVSKQASKMFGHVQLRLCLHIRGAMGFLAHDAFVTHNTRRRETLFVDVAHDQFSSNKLVNRQVSTLEPGPFVQK